MQKKEIDDLNDTIKWFKTARRNNDMACILPDGPMMKNIIKWLEKLREYENRPKIVVSNLYDVKDRSGKTIIENVTFGEVVEHLKCSKAQVNNSRTSGDHIFGEYTVEMVDRKLSRRKDADLLREFDFIRFCLLAEMQERRQK